MGGNVGRMCGFACADRASYWEKRVNIVDVDFRWVERLVAVPERRYVKRPGLVLQWRKKVIDLRWKHPEPEWTDWQDVKTETEE